MPAQKRKSRKRAPKKDAAWPGTKAAIDFLERRSGLIALLLVAFASVRMAATYTVFSHTFDEPAHIVSGVEYLEGVFAPGVEHPPLARAAAGLGPFLAGARTPVKPGYSGDVGETFAGLDVLYHAHRYELNLALARLGVLPFFWMACFVVYHWGRRYFGPAEAAVAVFLFSFLPPVLGHGALATTDMALTAFLGAAFLAAVVWAERPTPRTALWFGAAGGMAVLSKFSSLAFFPACAALAWLWYWLGHRRKFAEMAGEVRRRIPTLCLASAVALLVIWAGYQFTFGKVDPAGIGIPAPALYQSVLQMARHSATGHMSYLFGRLSETGFWYYYPVVLAVKTPLGFAILVGAALALALRRGGPLRNARLPLVFAAGILLVAWFSRVNIGVRHVLPVYIGFSLAAAAAVVYLLREDRRRRWILYGILAATLWFAGSSLWIHPDYLAYTNELAGSEPEKVLADSDLDWGQDINRLSRRLREAGAREVFLSLFNNAKYAEEHGFPPAYGALPQTPMPGWNAIGVSSLKTRRMNLWLTHPEITPWPERYKPLERVGKTILLYYFPARAPLR